MKNYRKIYEKKCNIKIPKGYEIHHIDFNRENNDIFNLVMLPKKLHSDYHKKLEKYLSIQYEVKIKLQNSLDRGFMVNEYIKKVDLKIIEEFINVWYECMKYINYRDYLLGVINYNTTNIRIGE